MTTVAGNTTLPQTLERALISAVGAMSPATTERLVCITVPTPSADPVAMFEAAVAVGSRALWDQPAEQFSLVALGVAKEVTAYGEDRVQQLTTAWRQLTAEAVIRGGEGCPLAAPIALSGMAFQPADDRKGAWQSYPDALFTVPQFLFITWRESSWLATSIVLGPSEDGHTAVRSTLDDLSALLMRADRPMPDQPPPAMTVAEEEDSTQWMQAHGHRAKDPFGRRGEARSRQRGPRARRRATGLGKRVAPAEGPLQRMHDNLSATIILLNNDGGGIFSFLPQAEESEYFEELFGTPHGLDFRHAAEMYGLAYRRVEDADQFGAAVRESLGAPGVHLIEVRTDRQANVLLHRELWSAVSSAVRAPAAT